MPTQHRYCNLLRSIFLHPIVVVNDLPRLWRRRGVVRAVTRLVAIAALLLGSVPSLIASDTFTDDQRRSAAVALNYSRASLHRIRRNPSVRVMLEEQEKILNHLDLNGIADEEVLKLYSSVLDEISQIQIADRERVMVGDRYNKTFQRELGLNAFQMATEVATAQYGAAVRTGAASWWDYRIMTSTRDLDVFQVDKKRMTTIVEKSSQFLEVAWKMARAKQIPDRWLVRNDDLDKLENAQRETDPAVRLRVLKRMEGFMECFPPYLYYVARTQQSMGQLFAASESYQKLLCLGDGHFRKDEMLAAGLANLAIIQAFLSQAAAPETARKAMCYSSEAWEANLVCANVLQKFGRFDEAEDAILRNLDVNLERQQSRIALLGLYYVSDNKAKMLAVLQDPDWIKDIPMRQLLMCAEKIGRKHLPPTVLDQLTTTLQGTPRLNVGRDDFVVAVSPVWHIQDAAITLVWGDREFSHPRVTSGRDSILLSFDGIAEFGNPISSLHDQSEVLLILKYPDSTPIRLTLKSKNDDSKSLDISNIKLIGRRHPVYRVVGLQQNDARLSLQSDSEAGGSIEPPTPAPRTRTTRPETTNEDPTNDDTVVVSPH